jgi:hypothetical protein
LWNVDVIDYLAVVVGIIGLASDVKVKVSGINC